MDDPSGYLVNSSDDWTVLSLPAIAEAEDSTPIGPGKFHHQQIGQALHPTHVADPAADAWIVDLG
jgi:hypothetical protein